MKEILFFFSAIGAFNGLLLFVYLFFIDKKQNLSKFLLGALILTLSIRIGKSAFLHFDQNLSKIYLQIGLTACFFVGPLLFFYLKSVLNNIARLPMNWKWTLITMFIAIIGIGILRPYEMYPDLWNHYILYIIYWSWLGFVLASAYIMRKVIATFLSSTQNSNPDERWLLNIFIANVVIFTSYFLVAYGLPRAYYLTGPLVFSFFLYLGIFGYVFTDSNKFTKQDSLRKYKKKKISDDDAKGLIAQLEELMKTEKLYNNPKLKLKDLAEKLNTSTHQLSQLLNDNLEKGFAKYVNEYRVNEACQLISKASNLSLEGIGYEVGFNSKSTFYSTFKKFTGSTPANFQSLQSQSSSEL